MASETFTEFDSCDVPATARFLIRTVDIWETESAEQTLINFKATLLSLLLLNSMHLAIDFVAFDCLQMFFVYILFWIDDTLAILDLENNLKNMKENMLEMEWKEMLKEFELEESEIIFEETTVKASLPSYDILDYTFPLELALTACCILLVSVFHHKKKLDGKIENTIIQFREDPPKQKQTCHDESCPSTCLINHGEAHYVEEQLEEKEEPFPRSEHDEYLNLENFLDQKNIATEKTKYVANVTKKNTYNVRSETRPNDSPKCCEMKLRGKIIELQCTTCCHFSIHLRCADKLRKVDPKKSLTGKPCLTPDCWGLVTTVSWKYQNGKVYRTEKVEVPNIKRNVVDDGVKQPVKRVKPSLKPFVLKVQKDISSSNQKADIRHLVADSRTISRSLQNEEKFADSKQRKGPTKRGKTKKNLNIELNPIIPKRCEEFVSKEIVLKLLLQNCYLEGNAAKAAIANFVDGKCMVLRKDIPIIIENAKADFESEQKAIEEDIVEKNNKEVDNSDDDVCPICLDAIAENEMEVLDCAHEYHQACISQWMKRNSVCPECRAYIKLLQEFPPIVRRRAGS